MDQDQLPGQMNIFDFLTPLEIPLDDLPEDEMVKMIAEATGLDFKYIDDFWGWQFKKQNVTFSVHYSNYNMTDSTARFISTGFDTLKQGVGSPCDSIEEAIRFFKRALFRLDEGTRQSDQKGAIWTQR